MSHTVHGPLSKTKLSVAANVAQSGLVGHPFAYTVGFADPSPPYMALKTLYEKHLAELLAAAGSNNLDLNEILKIEPADATKATLKGLPETVLVDASKKPWHHAVAKALRQNTTYIKQVLVPTMSQFPMLC